MDITDIHIDLVESRNGNLRAFCSVVFDNALVVHEVKVLEEPTGLIVSMPTEENTRHCVKCDTKNPILAKFCNRCGIRLVLPVTDRGKKSRSELYTDVAYPLNNKLDRLIQEKVIKAYKTALKNPPKKASRTDGFLQK